MRAMVGPGRSAQSTEPEEENADVQADTKCKNSVQGKELLVDTFGAICHRDDTNEGGCCEKHIDKLSCNRCDDGLKCCDSFEYCISCCLRYAQVAGQPQATDAAFITCLDACRTGSKSTVHGNAYMHSYMHCYTDTHADLNSMNIKLGPDYVEVAAKISGQTCTELCAEQPAPHTRCVDGLLHKVNDCETLQKHFKCKDCQKSGGLDQPAFVSLDADSKLNPGNCLYSPNGELFDCSGRHPATLRMCACVRADYPGLVMH